MEKWKDIEGYEGYYQVSNLGNVKSLGRYVNNPHGGKRYIRERILKPFNKKGYLYVDLLKIKQHRIHRLVAAAFIDNKDDSAEVNHINGIKNDNRVENLEWCTRSENMKHSYKTGLWNNQHTIVKRGMKTR